MKILKGDFFYLRGTYFNHVNTQIKYYELYKRVKMYQTPNS